MSFCLVSQSRAFAAATRIKRREASSYICYSTQPFINPSVCRRKHFTPNFESTLKREGRVAFGYWRCFHSSKASERTTNLSFHSRFHQNLDVPSFVVRQISEMMTKERNNLRNFYSAASTLHSGGSFHPSHESFIKIDGGALPWIVTQQSHGCPFGGFKRKRRFHSSSMSRLSHVPPSGSAAGVSSLKDPLHSNDKNMMSSASSTTDAAPPVNSRTKRVYGAETNPPLPSMNKTIRQTEENWEEADAKLRRLQAIEERKENKIRSDNVMRAIRGNIVICIAKFAAWTTSGSSALLSEFVHSLVDTLNQGLILVGLRDSNAAADRKHPYGYGKSLYFWSLISAMGTFWMGAGIAGRHSIEQLLHPSLSAITWEVWSVLVFSFMVDGYVLGKTIADIRKNQPKDVTLFEHMWKIRDPALMAILLEDGAACLGVVMAGGGIVLTAATGMPIFDGMAGVGVSALLAGMGLVLVRLNKEFLLGQAQDRKTIEGIQRILLEQESIEHVHSMQSQVLGHGKFSFKAEVDFDGTYLAAKLMPRYQREFGIVRDNLDQELRVLLSWFAEDVMRTVEREVRRIEYEVRKVYPGAVFIELEPYSKDFYRYAVDDAMESRLKRIEIEALNRYLKSMYMDNFEKITKAAKVPTTGVESQSISSEAPKKEATIIYQKQPKEGTQQN